ncbi:MAG: SixA phosphatase family protein [Bosea sp. (in: a-proteobacteria)]|uniref:SixA phosphatase family protein n=1 Tax=unclassified Bosea (in: a-proteobacteria) TaxID=2653178 RepID=UPI000964C41B|nr:MULTISPECIES: histidine phosphatase family protein [unclassified Bosea (in: a-proteobacteria)]MBN9456263.1 histidine phosphatase family protein [Bosea sp. (in: a-proteobacteria)]OJV05751.1 MAG: phosphoglycerate mutase [Bosea sp. 67-29]
MRRLMLLRHAKSNWPAGVADRDRPLAARGREAAPAMGRYLAEELLLPDLVLISPAKRTVETWELVASMLPEKPATQYEPRIYEAKPGALLYVVQETEPSVKTLLMVGHNPGFEELAQRLTGHGDRYAAARMSQKYPTAGLAVLDFAVDDWRDIGERGGRLERFVTPASLGEGPDE